MARINTNVSSLVAQRVLGQNNKSLSTSLERLSTGLKINTGKDDPAGLIASENLRSEKTGITAALENAERAGNVIGIAEGGLSEVSSLLNEVQGLVNDSANTGGLSQEEIDANQLQVDSILNTINRLAQSTSFQGQKLLNGAKDYTVSGATGSNFQNLRVNRAKLLDGADLTVAVTVTSAATQAKLSGAVATIGSGAATTIRITGKEGAEEITFAAGTTATNVAAAINERTAATGVKASGTDILSTGFGSDEFATVEVVQGTFAGAGTDAGSDANVSVNGSKAETKGDSVIYRSAGLDIEFDLGTASNVDAATASFTVTGGGANFALGSKVTEGNKESIGIGAVDTGNLGLQGSRLSTLASGQANSLSSDNIVTAQKTLDEAIKQVSSIRGRLGAFQKFTIGSTVNSLQVAYENTSAAESAIRDTDFAEETAALTRSQILQQASTTVLSQANSAPQSALALLR